MDNNKEYTHCHTRKQFENALQHMKLEINALEKNAFLDNLRISVVGRVKGVEFYNEYTNIHDFENCLIVNDLIKPPKTLTYKMC